jgi:hypothetical protein
MTSISKKLTFDPKEFKGSRLRCLQLTSLHNDGVAGFLTELVKPHAQVHPDGIWRPRGMLSPNEVELGRTAEFLSKQQREQLIDWWLAIGRNTSEIPNWDVVSKCAIEDRSGLVLVEAKAHPEELKKRDSSGPEERTANASRRLWRRRNGN